MIIKTFLFYLILLVGCSDKNLKSSSNLTGNNSGSTSETGNNSGSTSETGNNSGSTSETGNNSGSTSEIHVHPDSSVFPTCKDNFKNLLKASISKAPARQSNQYQVPKTEEMDAAENFIKALVNGDYPSALNLAPILNINPCRNTENNPTILGFFPKEKASTFALLWREGETDKLIIESPHPMFDGTRDESVEIFLQTKAKVLLSSGYHRCSHNTSSSCSGVTSSCGGDNIRYPISDPAHNLNTLYHHAHIALFKDFPDFVYWALHGMAAAGVSVSSSSTGPLNSNSIVRLFADGLAKEFKDSNLTSCEKGTALPVATRQCGTTDVQGRLTNGSNEACKSYVKTDNGRFIHMEQSSSYRGKGAVFAKIMTSALEKMGK